MSENRNWQYELNEYIKQGEPSKAERSDAWKTAIGLQDVDGLQTSDYLLDTAKEHIEGKINIADAQKRIESYYQQSDKRKQIEKDTKEADIVSARIAALLGEKTFQFSPAEYKEIHRRLFDGVFDHAGKIRTYNITKNEWVLNGETVTYASFDSINATLDYDFKTEKEFDYSGLSVNDSVKHIARFASDIWQIHPFGEGNTRATAVFIIKYLKTFGFDISNDIFAENSWYFRNALVRANYNNLKSGITATTNYLEMFFENLLLNSDNELKNRYLHIDFAQSATQSAKNNISKCQKCTLKELAVLNAIKDNKKITQKELAEKTENSERTIKRLTVTLQEKGLIRRKNGKRNGEWEILVEI
ncbi:MAG: Fic family protein [Clostridiales bacterium]|nr:Fic family protein [Clostridiales bacterium]